MSQARDLIEKVAAGQSPAQVVKPITETAGFSLHDDPVDIAASILEHGMTHPAFMAITHDVNAIKDLIAVAKRENDGIKRAGGGNISAPDLVRQHVLKKVHDLLKTVQTVHDQLDHALSRK